ncbi:MAG: helix-turn-helix transcriptional regulator [Deltaproteobacteria bacterium]|nr:helix-turn-helix transcriptional regulator [Deltaproteobacteria bacterium]
MKAQVLTPDRELEIYQIGLKMKEQHLTSDFISAAVRTAVEFEGVYDLMRMWDEETDQKERDETLADIQDMIDDCAQTETGEAPYIKFTDLDAIAKNVHKFKDNLRIIVEKKCGLKELSKLTGIPQPSLSRFFSTSSMPRRTTLLKIAHALKLDAVTIATEWYR